MKKKLPVIAVIILVLAICVSAWFYGYYNHESNDNLPTLAAIAEMSEADVNSLLPATVYKGNIIKNLIMDCQSYTKYRPNETTGGIFVSWRRKEELPTGV